MLNGDVLTDIDLTAQIAQHEATGARATLALTPVEDPSAYGLVRLDGRRRGDRVRREALAPDQIDTNNISAGAYVLERSVLDLLEPGKPASIERDVFPRLVGDGLYGYVGDGYWLDIGTPERYLQGTFDILEGTVDDRGRGADGRRASLCVGRRRRERTGGSSRRRSSRPAAGSARARRSAGAWCSSAASRSASTRRSSARSCSRARRSAPTARSAAASSARGVHDRRRLPRRRPQRARRGRHARRRQHGLQRRADLPGRRRSPTGRSGSDGRSAGRRRRSPRSTRPARRPRSSTSPTHLRDALWRVDSAGVAPVDAPGGVIVAGMGGSAVGGRLAQRRARRRASTRPFVVADGYALPRWVGPRARSCCARATPATPRRRSPPTTTRSSAARRGSSPPPAARSPSAPGATACR